ncbi:MAG: ATP-binding protein [Bdellovibrionota bacterium]
MKVILRTLLSILGSIGAVLLQKYLVTFDQWIIIYFWVIAMAWYGKMFQGIVCSVASLGLAGFLLIPPEKFGIDDALMLLVLTFLGIWISFSMEKYHEGKIQLSESEKVAKAKGFLDTLIDNIPLMVFVKDAHELRFTNFNEAGLKLLGHKREDLIGKNDFDFFPSDQAIFFQSKDREVLLSGEIKDIAVEEINTAHGKRILHTRKIPILDEQNRPLYLLGVSEDITDKLEEEKVRAVKLQEEAASRERTLIQERENLVAQAISTLSQTLDYQETIRGIVRVVVPALGDWAVLSLVSDEGKFLRTAGLHRDSNLQIYIDEFIRDFPPTEEDQEVQKALHQGEGTLEIRFSEEELTGLGRNPRKTEIYHKLGTSSCIIIPLWSRDGVQGVLSISRGKNRPSFDELDFSLAKEIGRRAGTILDNTRLFQSTQKAVQARDEFLSIASHELKTPITSLRLQLEMMNRNVKMKEVDKPIKNAIRQVDRLTLLVNDLLDVGRLESGKMNYHMKVTYLSDLVNEVAEAIHPQFAASGTQLEVRGEANPSVVVDSYRMEQALVNLLNNALKYGAGKPVIVSVSAKDNRAQLTVMDHGMGIPESQIAKIFDKFERGGKDSSIAGLGLGLYITHEIIKVFKGTIEVRSEVGEWTEFVITLPLA